ncbi:MAG: alpha/beta hydrolase [Acidobacteria bacterium]|nr:MAG: alpha/beta hydrolase [Acidobacteriota bacterium]
MNTQPAAEPFADETPGQALVRGFLHRPHGDPATRMPDPSRAGALVLTHGAGSNCRAPLLVAVAEAFSTAGFLVLRCDLPFRQARPHGPPFGGSAAQDRDGLRRALQVINPLAPGRLFLGGHSYGGRQASMLLAEDAALAAGLLLLSYPLHPPKNPSQLRTAHFPKLRVQSLFVHGTRDPFGSIDEMRSALELLAAPRNLLVIEGAGHDLSAGGHKEVGRKTMEAFGGFMGIKSQAL